jgi:hypothetical protein
MQSPYVRSQPRLVTIAGTLYKWGKSVRMMAEEMGNVASHTMHMAWAKLAATGLAQTDPCLSPRNNFALPVAFSEDR